VAARCGRCAYRRKSRHDKLISSKSSSLYLYLYILQHVWLQRATASGFDQRGNVIVRDTAMKADVCLDRRAAKMSIEGHLGRFQTHVLMAAVEQLASPLDSAGRQLRQLPIKRPRRPFRPERVPGSSTRLLALGLQVIRDRRTSWWFVARRRVIVSDDGTELTSNAVLRWAAEHGIGQVEVLPEGGLSPCGRGRNH
jgi:hypothetical protein